MENNETKYATVPVEPTEEMIRAACLAQSTHEYDSYEEWADNHSSGIVERIRTMIIHDYKVMISAYTNKQ